MCAECVWAKSSQSAAGWHTFAASARAGRWSRQWQNRCRQPSTLKVARPVWPRVCCSHTRTSNRNIKAHVAWRHGPWIRSCRSRGRIGDRVLDWRLHAVTGTPGQWKQANIGPDPWPQTRCVPPIHRYWHRSTGVRGCGARVEAWTGPNLRPDGCHTHPRAIKCSAVAVTGTFGEEHAITFSTMRARGCRPFAIALLLSSSLRCG